MVTSVTCDENGAVGAAAGADWVVELGGGGGAVLVAAATAACGGSLDDDKKLRDSARHNRFHCNIP